MLPFNEDFSTISSQLDEMFRKYFQCNDLEQQGKILASICSLGPLSYEFNLDYLQSQKFIDSIMSCKDYLTNRCLYQTYSDFIENKDYHGKVFSNCFQYLNRYFENNWKPSHLYSFSSMDIVHDEDLHLLYDFFNTKAPYLRKTYDDLVACHNLYSSYHLLNDQCLIYFNLYTKSPLIFLTEQPKNLAGLNDLVHELGHAFDFEMNFKDSSFEESFHHLFFNVLGETMSIYHSQQFLEFLLEDKKYKDDAIFLLKNFFHDNIKLLWESYVLTLPSKKSMLKNITHIQSLNVLETELVFQKKLTKNSISFYDRFVNLNMQPVYTYGFLFANYLLEHPEDFPKFRTLEHQDFTVSTLESMAITSDKLVKSLVKRTNTIFNKYI